MSTKKLMAMSDEEYRAWREKELRKLKRYVRCLNWFLCFMPMEVRLLFAQRIPFNSSIVQWNEAGLVVYDDTKI